MARGVEPLYSGADNGAESDREYTVAHAAAADRWLTELMFEALDGQRPEQHGVALLAVGGYGWGHLWPQSDLDVVLLHEPNVDIGPIAERLWYPIWDRGLALGHFVGTVADAVTAAGEELDRATAFLDTRRIVGEERLVHQFTRQIDDLWRGESDRYLSELAVVVDERHRHSGDVAFTIEPDLKQGRGGIRDIQSMRWASRAVPGFAFDLLHGLADEVDMLLATRVALHRHTGRPDDVVALDTQDAVAESMGYPRAEDLMARVAEVGRSVAWNSDQLWERYERRRVGRRPRPAVPISDRVVVRNDYLEIAPGIDVAAQPLLLLELAELAAHRDIAIGRDTLADFAESGWAIPEPWPEAARQRLANIFLAGRAAIDVVEDLDHYGLMTQLLPEWEAVRCKPQRNVLHTFTVDRHLCEAAANTAIFADSVDRPDLLAVGALLHDIGKGFPGDHTEVGMEVIEAIASRMGYPPEEAAVLIDLCRLHLLLPDAATRRDLADPGTIRAVAAAVDSVEFLRLLAALSKADSKATGPAVWTPWRASLIDLLVERTAQFLEAGSLDEVLPEFPPPEVVKRMVQGERWVEGRGQTLTVVVPDEPLLFSRIAGVMALSGLDVLDASAFSDDQMAACEFVVQTSTGAPVEWPEVLARVEDALASRIAVSARVAQRARAMSRYRRRLSATPPGQHIHVDNTVSDFATVIDVHAPDTVGLLYRLTQALGEFGCDIRSARVQTLGPQAVDSFYLCSREGTKIVDEQTLREVEVALLEAMGEP